MHSEIKYQIVRLADACKNFFSNFCAARSWIYNCFRLEFNTPVPLIAHRPYWTRVHRRTRQYTNSYKDKTRTLRLILFITEFLIRESFYLRDFTAWSFSGPFGNEVTPLSPFSRESRFAYTGTSLADNTGRSNDKRSRAITRTAR